jgi:aldose 1-epimerase
VSLERSEGLWLLELRDRTRGQRVRVLPEVGGAVVEHRVRHRGSFVPLIDPPPDLKAVQADPMRWGCPVLFPFPNRIRDGVFAFEGRSHRFTESFLEGHHIHGLVYSRPWQIQRCDTGTAGATATLSFRSRSFPEIREQYPFPFELQASYTLSPAGLLSTLAVRNVGRKPLPMGIGLHPCLRLPIGPSAPRSACRLRVPARARWELEKRLPTGRVVPVSGPFELRAGAGLEGLELDDVFTDLETETSSVRCELEDGAAGLRTVLEMEREFREVVVYTPEGRSAVCIEPYTCATDAPNLQARGIDAGLRVLGPEERFVARVRVFAEAL